MKKNPWKKVETACNNLEKKGLNRIQANYNEALRTAIKRHKSFFDQVQAVQDGRIAPPDYILLQGDDAVAQWKQGFQIQLMQRSGIVRSITNDLKRVGVTVPKAIRELVDAEFEQNYIAAVQQIKSDAGEIGIEANFAQYDKRQLDLLADESEGFFTKLAYSECENGTDLSRRLQDQLMQATMLGESQREIIGRIRKVTGYEYSRAKRIAQTERTRVQSQGRYLAGQQAAAMGIGIYNEWSTRMINSRETHRKLD